MLSSPSALACSALAPIANYIIDRLAKSKLSSPQSRTVITSKHTWNDWISLGNSSKKHRQSQCRPVHDEPLRGRVRLPLPSCPARSPSSSPSTSSSSLVTSITSTTPTICSRMGRNNVCSRFHGRCAKGSAGSNQQARGSFYCRYPQAQGGNRTVRLRAATRSWSGRCHDRTSPSSTLSFPN